MIRFCKLSLFVLFFRSFVASIKNKRIIICTISDKFPSYFCRAVVPRMVSMVTGHNVWIFKKKYFAVPFFVLNLVIQLIFVSYSIHLVVKILNHALMGDWLIISYTITPNTLSIGQQNRADRMVNSNEWKLKWKKKMNDWLMKYIITLN